MPGRHGKQRKKLNKSKRQHPTEMETTLKDSIHGRRRTERSILSALIPPRIVPKMKKVVLQSSLPLFHPMSATGVSAVAATPAFAPPPAAAAAEKTAAHEELSEVEETIAAPPALPTTPVKSNNGSRNSTSPSHKSPRHSQAVSQEQRAASLPSNNGTPESIKQRRSASVPVENLVSQTPPKSSPASKSAQKAIPKTSKKAVVASPLKTASVTSPMKKPPLPQEAVSPKRITKPSGASGKKQPATLPGKRWRR